MDGATNQSQSMVLVAVIEIVVAVVVELGVVVERVWLPPVDVALLQLIRFCSQCLQAKMH